MGVKTLEFIGYPEYTIDTEGNVYGPRGIKAPGDTGTGYKKVTLGSTCKGNRKDFLLHRLVAEAFIPNPNNLPDVGHKNDDRTKNNVENLEWVTKQDNLRQKHNRGRAANSKLNEKMVREIKEILSFGTLSNKEISKLYNVTPSVISNIKCGRLWSWITIGGDN